MQSKKLNLADPGLFGNDAGEDENPEILDSYFINQEKFSKFLGNKEKINFARARKGLGKSALLNKLKYDIANKKDDIVIHVTPSILASIKEPPLTNNHILMENYWKQSICALVNIEMALLHK